MAKLRACLKVLLFLILIPLYLMFSSLGQLFLRDSRSRRFFFSRLVHRFLTFACPFLGIQVKAMNVPKEDQNFLFVSNHMGMLDILVISSVRPSLFITSVEMQQTPGLGLICEMGGCLFVERRSRNQIHKEIEHIRAVLKQGLNLVLFPEGTSTNGERILPFKKSLLTAAAGSGVSILPVVLNYREANGEPMSTKWRDSVCWYGDQNFFAAVWRLFQLKSLVAEIEFLQPIQMSTDEERREVAARAQAQIEAKFVPIRAESMSLTDT